MTVIDVKSLSAKKIYEGELSFSFEPESGLLEIPFVSFASPVSAELRYEIYEDDKVSVKGTLAYTLHGSCSRCLAPAEKRFTGEVDALFEPGEGDGITYGYRQGVVRLEEALRDALLFSFPARLLCGNCGDPGDGE